MYINMHIIAYVSITNRKKTWDKPTHLPYEGMDATYSPSTS